MTMLKQDGKPIEHAPRVPIPLYVLSDSTGNLARHMVTGFLTQFPAGSFQVRIKPFVSEPHRWSESSKAIATRPGIVFHAVVSPQLKKKIGQHCETVGCPCCDLTGPAVEFLAKASRVQPTSDPQRLHGVDSVYCGRINAMTYTLEHDDGLGLDGLSDADIVLVGVSRTGKTPTSVYLAMLGFPVANVSLAAQVEPAWPIVGACPGEYRRVDHRSTSVGGNSHAQTDGLANDADRLQRSAQSPGGSGMEPAALREAALPDSGCNRPGD